MIKFFFVVVVENFLYFFLTCNDISWVKNFMTLNILNNFKQIITIDCKGL